MTLNDYQILALGVFVLALLACIIDCLESLAEIKRVERKLLERERRLLERKERRT